MKQIEVKTMAMMLVVGANIINALEQFAAAIGLLHITKAVVEGARNELIAARDNYENGKVELASRRAALRTVVAAARQFATTARDVLRRTLPKTYTQAWDAAGFRGSLGVSKSPADLQVLLLSLKSYFTTNATLEVAGLNLTAAGAEALLEELEAADAAVKLQLTALDDLKGMREAKVEKMKGVISSLLDELSMKLDPLDARWLSFGFNKPGAKATPGVPTGLIATLIGPNVASLKWTGAPRAEHYRVWRKINGVDTEMLAVGCPTDVAFLLEGLPANSTIQIAVSAVNNGGESQMSELVVITT